MLVTAAQASSSEKKRRQFLRVRWVRESKRSVAFGGVAFGGVGWRGRAGGRVRRTLVDERAHE